MDLSLSGCGAGKARQSGSFLLFALPKRAGQKNKGRCFLRSFIRKQSRKILTARRHLPRYRALHSTKECRGGAATKAPVGLSTGQTGLRSAQMPSVVFGRQGCSPLPCICRHAAILRCFAVLSEPLFSYVTRALGKNPAKHRPSGRGPVPFAWARAHLAMFRRRKESFPDKPRRAAFPVRQKMSAVILRTSGKFLPGHYTGLCQPLFRQSHCSGQVHHAWEQTYDRHNGQDGFHPCGTAVSADQELPAEISGCRTFRRPQSGHKVLTRATERILPMLLSPSGVHGPQPAGFGKKGVKAHSQPARPAAGRSVVRDKSQCYKKGLWKLSNKGPGGQLPTRKIA